MNKFIFFISLFTLGLSGCSKKQPEGTMATETKIWNVYKNDIKVLIIRDQPGPLISSASMPPGFTPPKHPFLSGRALELVEEGTLQAILDKAKNFDDFISLLRKNGYRVEQDRLKQAGFNI